MRIRIEKFTYRNMKSFDTVLNYKKRVQFIDIKKQKNFLNVKAVLNADWLQPWNRTAHPPCFQPWNKA